MTIISNDNLKQSIVRFINMNTLLVSWTKYDAFQKSADLKNINDEIERYECSAWYNFQVKSKRGLFYCIMDFMRVKNMPTNMFVFSCLLGMHCGFYAFEKYTE